MIRAGTFFPFFFFFYKLESLRVIYESRRWTDALLLRPRMKEIRRKRSATREGGVW